MAQDEINQTVLDSRLIEKFEVHRDFTKVFLDAFVLINSEKRVLKFNSMFCTTLGVKAIDVRKSSSLDDLMTSQIQGTPKSSIEMILESEGPLRIDEVHCHRVACGDDIQLIISSYPYFDNDGRRLGACVLMRDVTAESNLQTKFAEKTIQSITDPLTGLYTRRYFEEIIDKELERCRAKNIEPSLGILMFDLDRFKTVNDTYGHQCGDFVLTETARVLRANSRKSDVLGRYGGEELLVILFGTNPSGCCLAAEKFRLAIQNNGYTFGGKRIPVTSSVGVSCFSSVHDTREQVVARADQCLYDAKHNGRNCVFADFGGKRFKVTDNLPQATPPSGET